MVVLLFYETSLKYHMLSPCTCLFEDFDSHNEVMGYLMKLQHNLEKVVGKYANKEI